MKDCCFCKKSAADGMAIDGKGVACWACAWTQVLRAEVQACRRKPRRIVRGEHYKLVMQRAVARERRAA